MADSEQITITSDVPGRLHRAVLLIVLLLASAAPTPPSSAQEDAPGMPDVATLEAEFEKAFTAALELPEDVEPMLVLQTWGSVSISAIVLERARGMSEGLDPSVVDGEAVTGRVLERWRRLRPEAGGPDLLRAFRIQDPDAKRAAVIALGDRYPDDPLVVWQTIMQLRHAGEVGRAVEITESFLSRNPDHPVAYSLLLDAVAGNSTREAEVLERWSRAVPGDPRLVSHWMGSSLPQRDPEATRRVLGDFFAGRPGGAADLTACLQALRKGGPSFAEPARACVARLAGAADVPAEVSEQATSAMAESAAADGDWSAMLDVLDVLEPQARVRALIAAARGLEAPERCGETVELLTVAAEVLAEDAYRDLASALRRCAEEPGAGDLYLALLRRAPTAQMLQVLRAWVFKVNGVYRGELPEGAAELLEQRLRAEPEAGELYVALDVVYQLADPAGRRFDLLHRWQRQAPASLRGEQALDLAWELVYRGEPQAAVELLEEKLDPGFDPEIAENLWELYLETATPERAERFAADLIATGDRWHRRTGHVLAARSALRRQDLGAAERHYWQALEDDSPDHDVALELLFTVGRRGDAAAMETMARRVCEQTRLADVPSKVPECAAELLTQAGAREAAEGLLEARSTVLPEDLGSLRKLAVTAQSAGQSEVAERALRRIWELDPVDPASWTGLADFFAKQGRADELADLFARAREQFSPPPIGLYRATGRALTADRPREAIEVLLEGRGTLPEDQRGDWSRGWIDHELRQAYQRLGELTGVKTPAAGPAPIKSFAAAEPAARPEGRARELRLAAHELQSGAGGRYAPDAAAETYARAAALGDPLATYRLALLYKLGSAAVPAGAPDVQELYRRSVREVEALAAEGDPFAQYLVGTAALVGLGGGVDPATARRWLEPAAAGGESWAWFNLGWMRETGRGYPAPDLESAVGAYRRASETGNADGMFAVARLTLTLSGSRASCEDGLRWLRQAARAGHARAAAFLGKLLFYGYGECVARDPQGSLEWLEAGAATHQPGADYDLALALLLAGDGVASLPRGTALLEQVASRPDVLAVETLAFLRATGVALPRDPAEARRLTAEAARLGSDGFPRLLESARDFEVYREILDRGVQRLEALSEQDDVAAMAPLARLHSAGSGARTDLERAAELALRAAAKGDVEAMRLLVHSYRHGAGVEADAAEAARWRRRCAEAGNSFCMMFEGQALIDGDGIERDLESGLRWLRRSAEAGNWWAIGDLGRLYDQGRYGLARNPQQAAAWKRRVADLGDPEATGWLVYHGY
jgi:hypothetical protein